MLTPKEVMLITARALSLSRWHLAGNIGDRIYTDARRIVVALCDERCQSSDREIAEVIARHRNQIAYFRDTAAVMLRNSDRLERNEDFIDKYNLVTIALNQYEEANH